MARIGRLFANQGAWNGTRIAAEAYLESARRRSKRTEPTALSKHDDEVAGPNRLLIRGAFVTDAISVALERSDPAGPVPGRPFRARSSTPESELIDIVHETRKLTKILVRTNDRAILSS